jgi:hypothetical protein
MVTLLLRTMTDIHHEFPTVAEIEDLLDSFPNGYHCHARDILNRIRFIYHLPETALKGESRVNIAARCANYRTFLEMRLDFMTEEEKENYRQNVRKRVIVVSLLYGLLLALFYSIPQTLLEWGWFTPQQTTAWQRLILFNGIILGLILLIRTIRTLLASRKITFWVNRDKET